MDSAGGLLVAALGICAGAAGATRGGPGEFFDDFSYVNVPPGQSSDPIDPAFTAFGWEARSGGGGPGPGGAVWRRELVTWEADSQLAGNRIMRMRAATAGTGATTQQSEVRTVELRFLEGTTCARVWFSDAPRAGTPQPSVQAFFSINTLGECALNYAEVDFEYLPNDNFGDPCGGTPALHMTTWETWDDAGTHHPRCAAAATPLSTVPCGPREGWHTLCIQVFGGEVRYFLDGALLAGHGGAHYPETAMRLSFNHWFVASGLVPMGQAVEYDFAVDWVVHVRGALVTPVAMNERLALLRDAGVPRLDTLDCTAVAGDLDGDGDANLADWSLFAECLAGPHCGPGDGTCGCADLTGDYDVDLADFAAVQR